MTHTASVQALGRTITGALLGVYALLVAFMVFWPTPIDRGFGIPLLRFAALVRGNGMVWLAYDHVEFVANVLMFVPLGLGLTVVLPRAVHWLVPLLGLSASVSVEVVQALVLPDRFGGPMDVLANTLGATLGWAVALIARSIAARRRRNLVHE